MDLMKVGKKVAKLVDLMVERMVLGWVGRLVG